ncbi:Re/Si-specific NAD(P)(+) transhydrogenase subunit alpha [Actinocatenispora sera]|uniref:proton-translocating NAD(P)(+) transhydrogenase n=1 Tax=Actinocatenispora sera TaxID=390989 RepID=A0A810KYY6_9ACTN|nr:Re/Si-specific NAD(P)(+) transhydrogenase subunit alpha [Actinocatenispora sera]BCJ27526.1 NAD(P) transhydrogenase subunit alpha [Actinocatenispora sera]
MRIGVVRETAAGERRVAMVPEVVSRLARLPAEVLVASGAGEAALFADADYTQAGAQVVEPDTVYGTADVLLSVGPPPDDLPDRVHSGQTLIGLYRPATCPELIDRLAAAGVTLVSLDRLPRTLSRAQAADALTSQANVAGYRAVLVAAAAYPRFFPMLVTAAGTVRPAEVLVLGAGVAGLQAIGTARRLGAQVRAYDVRPETREQVESVGGTFVTLADVGPAEGTGGYARALSDDEQRVQQERLAAQIARHDVVITTAQVPGAAPPLLVTAEAVKAMRPGSVIVDLAAGPYGGNVAVSVPDATIRTDNGVTVIGAGHLASDMAPAASTAYARNVSAVLAVLVSDGAVHVDLDDEIQAGIVITHAGERTAS